MTVLDFEMKNNFGGKLDIFLRLKGELSKFELRLDVIYKFENTRYVKIR